MTLISLLIHFKQDQASFNSSRIPPIKLQRSSSIVFFSLFIIYHGTFHLVKPYADYQAIVNKGRINNIKYRAKIDHAR